MAQSQASTTRDGGTGFEGLLEETIRTSIKDLLGESSMRAIVFHLGLEHLAMEPKLFDAKLRDLLNAPASIIEEIVIKDLFKRLDLLYAPSGSFDFLKMVDSAKKYYAIQAKRGHG